MKDQTTHLDAPVEVHAMSSVAKCSVPLAPLRVGRDSRLFAMRYTTTDGWSSEEQVSSGIHDNPYDVTFAVDHEGNALAVYDIEGCHIMANQFIAGEGWGGVYRVTSGN